MGRQVHLLFLAAGHRDFHGAADGNAATREEPNWASLFPAPPFQDYPSGHSCASAAATTVLSKYFGENTHFTVESDALLGITRSFRNFSEAVEEINNAESLQVFISASRSKTVRR